MIRGPVIRTKLGPISWPPCHRPWKESEENLFTFEKLRTPGALTHLCKASYEDSVGGDCTPTTVGKAKLGFLCARFAFGGKEENGQRRSWRYNWMTVPPAHNLIGRKSRIGRSLRLDERPCPRRTLGRTNDSCFKRIGGV